MNYWVVYMVGEELNAIRAIPCRYIFTHKTLKLVIVHTVINENGKRRVDQENMD